MDTQDGGTESRGYQPMSPRPSYPTTPSRDVPPSPFTLFSEDKSGHLRVASPCLSLEEVARILAEEWAGLSEEAKTPYKVRANEELLRHEAMDAALVLTQIGTPSFRPGPATPVTLGKNARRCLDIGTPNWQSPRVPTAIACESFDTFGSDLGYPEGLSGMLSLAGTTSACPLSPGEENNLGGARGAVSFSGAAPMTPITTAGGRPSDSASEQDSSGEGGDRSSKPHAPSRESSRRGATGARGEKRKPTASVSDTAQNKRSKSELKKTFKAGQGIVAKMSKKDPNRPKRNRSSYMFFYTEQCNPYKAARPSMTTMDLGRALGEVWRGLSEKERLPYTQRAKVDRERYENDLRTIARNASGAEAASASSA